MQFDLGLAALVISVLALIVSGVLTLYKLKLMNESRGIQSKMAEFSEQTLDIAKEKATEDKKTKTIQILSNIVEVLENVYNHLQYFLHSTSMYSQKEIDGLKDSIARFRKLFSLHPTIFPEYRQYLEMLERVGYKERRDVQKAIQDTRVMLLIAKEKMQTSDD